MYLTTVEVALKNLAWRACLDPEARALYNEFTRLYPKAGEEIPAALRIFAAPDAINPPHGEVDRYLDTHPAERAHFAEELVAGIRRGQTAAQIAPSQEVTPHAN